MWGESYTVVRAVSLILNSHHQNPLTRALDVHPKHASHHPPKNKRNDIHKNGDLPSEYSI